MPLFFEMISRLVPLAGFDYDALSRVQTGFGGSGVSLGWVDLLCLVLVLILLLCLTLLLRIVLKPKRIKIGQSEIDQIVDQEKIRNIINRSTDLRAVYDIEVFNQEYKEIYKGPVLGFNQDDLIEVELGAYAGANLDFKDKGVNVAFRMSRRGKENFYQFNTISKSIGFCNIQGRRERCVRLALPQAVSRGQKRRHLRLKPTRNFAFKASLLAASSSAEPMPLGGFRTLHEAEVSDLSIGGLQIVITARGSDLKVRPQENIYARFRLPASQLDIQNPPSVFFVQAKVLEVQRLTSGRRVMSRQADENMVGPHLIRLLFTGRGIVNLEDRTVSFRPATALVFEDLARWIQAYQRRFIQEEKGTRRRPERVKNIYASQPPEVENKYPSQPLRRDTID